MPSEQDALKDLERKIGRLMLTAVPDHPNWTEAEFAPTTGLEIGD